MLVGALVAVAGCQQGGAGPSVGPVAVAVSSGTRVAAGSPARSVARTSAQDSVLTSEHAAPSAPPIATLSALPDDEGLAAIPSNISSPRELLIRVKGLALHLQSAGAPCVAPTSYNAVLRRTLTDRERRHFAAHNRDDAAMEVASVSLCGQAPQMMQAFVLNTRDGRDIVDVLMIGPSAVEPIIAMRVHSALRQMPSALKRLPDGCSAWRIIGSVRTGEKSADGRTPEKWTYGACGQQLDLTLTVPALGQPGPLDDVALLPG